MDGVMKRLEKKLVYIFAVKKRALFFLLQVDFFLCGKCTSCIISIGKGNFKRSGYICLLKK